MTRHIILFICLALKIASCNSDVPHKQFSPKLNHIADIDNLITQWQQELNVPNVGMGIIDNGKIIKTKVYGTTHNGTEVPDNMLFNIASVTKVVFTALALKLIENGELSLDEPLHPDFVDPDIIDDPRHQKLTPYTLLSQQSGFSNNWRWDHPTEKLVFTTEPGTEYNYSGEGMEYLRNAIESRFDKTLSQLSDSLIFEPLSMDDTRHHWDGKEDIDRFSLAYDTQGRPHDIDDHSTEDNAADDLITTASDLTKFGIYILNQIAKGISPYTDMTTTQTAISPNLNQGLGWRMVNDLSNGEYAIQHGGNDIGVAAIIVLLPQSKRGVIVLTNGDNGALICNNIIRAALPDVGNEIVHNSYKSGAVQKTIATSIDKLQEYNGVFTQPSGRQLYISPIENGIHLKMDGIPNLNFYRSEGDTFFSPDFDFELVFFRDRDGMVNETSLSFEGKNMIRCKKE